MEKIIKQLKIDLISLQPYFTIKNLVIFFAIGILYGVMGGQSNLVVTAIVLFTALFASYPFYLGDESGIDPLYRLFGLDYKSVVKGRYLMSLAMMVFAMALGLVQYMALAYYLKDQSSFFGGLAQIYISAFAVSLVMICIQYPLYFKLGYNKGKHVFTYVFFGVGLGAGAVAMFLKKSPLALRLIAAWIGNHWLVTGTLTALLLLAMVIISIQCSYRWYRQRDF